MIGVFQRRQLFVHPIQYWFVATTLIYVACLLIILEVQAFNTMLDNFENRIKTITLHSALVTKTYEAVTIHMKTQTPGRLTTALQTLDEEIRRFKSCLATVELKREGQPEQQRFEFDEASHLGSPTIMKAA